MTKACLLLHGSNKKTSTGKDFAHMFPYFLYAGYKPFAVDLPGYGKSPGRVASFRTSEVWTERGCGNLIVEIINLLTAKEVLLFGYDWGGTMALRIGARL